MTQTEPQAKKAPRRPRRPALRAPPEPRAPSGDPDEVLDFRECKNAARDHLPPGHAVREAMLREPDYMPRREMSAKIRTYAQLLLALRSRP